ncbi:hypothetical protein O6H91_04G044300 [Diphasiastrum complanatum]|uniref:Uncharacterized protein n=1 Tax=Diphasiastrum complanatum TaxID=34168 RepID=A0ACC2DWC2_DIPCM|nr:hypothetical protein O6H91_04G044300 [Diphasiastrum complanatum]
MENERATNIQNSGNTVLVALKLAPKSRELLTWIIAKLTKPGDHVVGVHVLNCSSSSDPNKTKFGPSTKQQLASTFQAVLGVYQALCSIKQIEVDIKILSGCGLRKVLVEAANEEKATKLILGSSKSHGMRRKNCLAKYCSERLPETCSILIVEHGKVVFEKTGRQTGSVVTEKKVHFFGASRSMPYNNRLRDAFESKLTQPFKGSENLLKNRLLSKSSQTAKPGACVSQGSTDNLSSSDEAFPSSPVSVLRDANFSQCRGTIMSEVRPSLQSIKLPKEHAKEAQNDWHEHAPRLLESTGCFEDSEDDCRGKSQSNVTQNCRPLLTSTQNVCLSTIGSNIFSEHPEKNQSPLHLCEQMDGCLEDCDHLCLNLAKKLQSITLGRTCKSFKYEELEQATSNFSPRNIVGKGGCSNVYEGMLTDGRRVAVKCLNLSADAEEELLIEVEVLATFCHRHIVPLLGYCVGCQKHLLVYEFAANGNLEEFLHGGIEKPVLEWAQRFKIALGTAQALAYLHDECPQSVISRDVKSSNILLTSSFEPQVSDFGLAKLVPNSTANITCTDVVGTFGYIAPEYFMFGKINKKTDVYSFGVVLLEIITGRPPIDNSKPKGHQNLVLWARPLLEAQKMDELVDGRLKGQYNTEQMNQMLLAASLCIRQSPKARPHMNSVVKLLCGEEDTVAFKVDDDDEVIGVDKESFDEQTKDDYNTTWGSFEVRKYLSLAMIGVDDEVASQCSMEQSSIDLAQSNENLAEYLSTRFSRSSSLDSV